jgi:hypothetical protein
LLPHIALRVSDVAREAILHGDRFESVSISSPLMCRRRRAQPRAEALKTAGIENKGVKLDETLGKRYVAFKDPDRIAWEFYSAREVREPRRLCQIGFT